MALNATQENNRQALLVQRLSAICAPIFAVSQAGEALRLISGSVPLVGGLAALAGSALQAGDCFIQTRRLKKVNPV